MIIFKITPIEKLVIKIFYLIILFYIDILMEQKKKEMEEFINKAKEEIKKEEDPKKI